MSFIAWCGQKLFNFTSISIQLAYVFTLLKDFEDKNVYCLGKIV